MYTHGYLRGHWVFHTLSHSDLLGLSHTQMILQALKNIPAFLTTPARATVITCPSAHQFHTYRREQFHWVCQSHLAYI